MKYVIRLTDEAESDLHEAAKWYERQSSKLGHEFLDSALELVSSIRVQPMLFPVVHREVRRALFRRFPFAMYYRIGGSRIVVVAIMHGSRHPRNWRSRK